MQLWDRLFFILGVVFLAAGVVCYGMLAMGGKNLFGLCFVFTMVSLLFFNLPGVLAKRRARRQAGQEKAMSEGKRG